MMLDILMTNKRHVLDAVRAFEAQMQSLARLIADGDEPALRHTLSTIHTQRREMFP